MSVTRYVLPNGSRCTFARWTYFDPEPDPLHDQDFHEFFWIEAGDGIEWINGGCRDLHPGALGLICASDVHAYAAARGGVGMVLINFAFPVAMWEALRKRIPGLRGGLYDQADAGRRFYKLTLKEVDRLRLLSHDLQQGLRDAVTCEAFFLGVMALLANRGRAQAASPLPGWLAEACFQIRIMPHFVEGTGALARLAGRSPEHVAREVKRCLGCTPTELVNDARLTYAAAQLCTTDRSILDIAADCGLENAGHFYALFRARFQTSPRRYRLAHAFPAAAQAIDRTAAPDEAATVVGPAVQVSGGDWQAP